MTKLHKGLMLLAAAAVMACVAVSVKSMRDLDAAREELKSIAKANEFLKKTLGDMTVAMAAKDKQIDSLEHGGCTGPHTAPPPSAAAPPLRNKAAVGEPQQRRQSFDRAPGEGAFPAPIPTETGRPL